MNLPQALSPFATASGARSVRIFKSGPGTQAAVAADLLARGRSVVMVVPGARDLLRLKSLLELMTPDGGAGFPDSPWIVLPPYPARSSDPGRWAARWAALYGLSRGGARGVLLGVDNLLPKWPSPDVLTHHHLRLAKGEEIPPPDLMEQLVTWGYSRTGMVTRVGEAAMRGDILDIFAPGYGRPLRLEFFGDTLDDIRLFDADTQRSRADLDEAVLLPAVPSPPTPGLVEEARAKWKRMKAIGELSGAACAELERRVEALDGRTRPGLYYREPASLARWLPQDAVWLLCGAGQLRTRLEEQDWAWTARLDEEAGRLGWRAPRQHLLEPLERARGLWMDAPQLHFEDLTVGENRDGLDLPEKELRDFEDLFWKPEERNRPWRTLLEALRTWERERPQTILSFRTEASRRKFLKLAARDGVLPATGYSPGGRGLFALVSSLRGGVEFAWNGALVLSEDVLQPAPRGARLPGADKDFKGLSGYEDLSPGDLLVHREWGLSRFDGLHRLELGGVSNDYLLLMFSGDDKLYLPVDRLDCVQRFKGPEGVAPTLDKLGGAAWSRAKSRARKAVEKVARELVEMYAWRKVAKGYAYEPMGDEYAEFEASFGFEETPDQEAAIRDVMADMELDAPMDRLVCGDVGFGKTEVAMRAAFRAAMAGRQVALLCPTTVLAEQHYQNFRRRMEGYPLNVAMLSRFVTPARRKAVLAAAKRGEIDILIGTHRLLSKDVELPGLGLLILDEEQRFGVRHKERVKELRKDVDVLTLTATPIPRTLQLSLSGIRGLSVMETPPVDRKPVRTSLLEREADQLKSILARELERQGQVFWVHNRVQGLSRVVEYVQALAPGARVGMAHGQMRERDLEEAVRGFWHGELDILVCTAIIESGLDFPRANTLVVDHAHMFGLGQLYQLRGRVGRSSRQAYAYFVVPSLDRLPEPSRKRLQVILDMDYLGAGFQVAMEDLRLRGAGNILGEAQSGTVAKVGLDLYLEMLEEEVRRLRGEKLVQDTSPELNILFEAHIPEEYVPDTRDRLRYYKALSSARNGAALEELAGELRDRFGPPPEPFSRFLDVLRLKRLLGALQVARADLAPGKVVLTWADEATAVAPDRLVAFVQEQGAAARLLPPGRLELRAGTASVREGLAELEKALTHLAGGATTPPGAA